VSPDEAAVDPGPVLEIVASRVAQVGAGSVRRALPQRTRRTIGAWCFVDHFGPATDAVAIGPHPHIGLHTVTWLLEGEAVHHDSLGSEQPLRPGQLNLMSAGHGIAHSEEGAIPPPRPRPLTHGAQLWVAQPDATRDGPPAFEHHDELPRVELGATTATVLLGALGDERSPARADTPIVGLDLEGRAGTAVVPLDPTFEHGVVVLDGLVEIDDEIITPGVLAYLGTGRDELVIDVEARARVLVLGGEPFPDPIHMWWNFVGPSREAIDDARAAWQANDEDRFAPVRSRLDRIDAPGTPWTPTR
jgi:redox-sensitive bicupin YhaK (pirin superfamily)